MHEGPCGGGADEEQLDLFTAESRPGLRVKGVPMVDTHRDPIVTISINSDLAGNLHAADPHLLFGRSLQLDDVNHAASPDPPGSRRNRAEQQ